METATAPLFEEDPIMFRKVPLLTVLAVLLAGAALPVRADVIYTKTGDKYEGYVVREDEKVLVVKVLVNGTPIAEMPIKKADIIKHIKGDKKAAADDSKKSGKAKTDPKSSKKKPAKKAAKKKTSKKKPSTKK